MNTDQLIALFSDERLKDAPYPQVYRTVQGFDGHHTTYLEPSDVALLLEALQLLKQKQNTTPRVENLKRYGLNKREIVGLKRGFFIAVDGEPFRDDIDEPDEFGQQASLIVEKTAGDAINDWLETALMDDGDLWEVVSLQTGEVVKSGHADDGHELKVGDRVELPCDRGFGNIAIIRKIEVNHAYVAFPGVSGIIRHYPLRELTKRENLQ